MSEQFIYFDNINTTLPDPEVIALICKLMKSRLGNPSSHIHSAGIAAGQTLDEARQKVASFIGAAPENIIFTSGATEANNLAIAGFLKANPKYDLAVSEIEHYSLINQARKFRNEGKQVSFIDVDNTGLVDIGQLEKIVQSGPTLVSIAPANPEIGTIQDIKLIGEICKKYDAILHCDVTTAATFLEIEVEKSGIGLLTLSGHNMYGPPGIGALYAAPKINIAPLFEGGNQENGKRPGTENFVGAAAMGEACEIIKNNRNAWNTNLEILGKTLWQGLADNVPFIHFTGHPEKRLPGHVSFWVEHIEGESLLLFLSMNGVMAASGSACSSNLKGKDEEDLVASHVLTAVGVPSDVCAGSITFSLARYNTQDEVNFVISIMPGIVEKLLAMSPSYSDYKNKKEIIHE
jgi:cysteine desulfurase